jgi:transcriptional regulator of acetoin/glycerol metabolism
VRLEDLPPRIAANGTAVSLMSPAPAAAPAPEPPREPPVEPDRPAKDRNREQLVRLLTAHHGNVAAVARELGKGRTQVLRWLERYAIDPDHYRP